MTDQPTKKSPVRKFVFFAVLLIIIVAFVGAYYGIKHSLSSGINNLENCTGNCSVVSVNHQETVIDNRGNTTLWDAVWKVVASIVGGTVVLGGFIYYLNYKREAFHTKEECIVAAREGLLKMGYPIDEREPKFSFQYFGGDSEKFPRWTFGFVQIGADHTKPIIASHDLITCTVSAKTLEVSNEEHGTSWEDVLVRYNNQRKGKWAVMNDPEKPMRDSLFDIGDSKVSVTQEVTPDEVEQ